MWVLWILIGVLACSAMWGAFCHFEDSILAILSERID